MNRRSLLKGLSLAAVAAAIPVVYLTSNQFIINLQKFNDAIDRNVLWYDPDAPLGLITDQLKQYMIESISNKEYYYAEGTKKLGNTIVKIIECNEEITKYFIKTKGCSLAVKHSSHIHNDIKLLIGITDTGNYLLGSC